MPRPTTERKCEVEGCTSKHYAKGKCQSHYNALRYGRGSKSRNRRAGLPPVMADYAYPDLHRGAPTGQRIVVWECPACGNQHLSSWLPLDPDPGLKMGTCRGISASQNAPLPMFYVLAPPEGSILTEPPAELAPRRSVEVA